MLVTAAVNAAVGTVARKALDSLIGGQPKRMDPTPLDELIQVRPEELESGEETFIISAEQEALILKALDTPEFGRLVQSVAISHIVLTKTDLEKAYSDFRVALESILLVEFGDREFEAQEAAVILLENVKAVALTLSTEALSTQMRGFLTARRSSSPASEEILHRDRAPLPQFVRSYLDIASDLSRLQRARHAAADIRREVSASFTTINTDHLLDGELRIDKRELFITRTLVEQGPTSSIVGTADLPIRKGEAGRVVVLGNPGVGKTTLINHLVAELAADESNGMVPLLVTCRNYSPDFQGGIDHWIASDFRLIRNANIPVSDVLDVVSTGQAVVLFDGLDEVIDLIQRRQLIEGIESFARRYPFCPIVATARIVGYDRMSLKEGFRSYALQEFSDDQVEEYARLWFQRRGAPEFAPRFFANSESIRDIRSNPLMLSLLCDVYRARGYLPRNRFDVYGNCANLLFTRWDSMRDIQAPPDHSQHGARLFEELAWLFHSSQSARAGIQERQLVQILAEFFRRNAGVEPAAAVARAKNFLNFCADRAWLLSSRYRDDFGERVFSFTHRTFLEYYAAQAVVKRSSDIHEVVKEIRKAFIADPSSVLCDLIMQYYESIHYDGGANILLLLIKPSGFENDEVREARLSLCLRMADAIALPSHVLDALVAELKSVWSGVSIFKTWSSSVALFSLNHDARVRIVQEAGLRREADDFGRDLKSLQLLQGLVVRWSWLYASRDVLPLDDGWKESIDDLLKDWWSEFPSWVETGVLTYGVSSGLIDVSAMEDRSLDDLIAYSAFDRGRAGLCTLAVFDLAFGLEQPEAAEILRNRVAREFQRLTRMKSRTARDLVDFFDSGAAIRWPESTPLIVLFWYCCVTHEITGDIDFTERLDVGAEEMAVIHRAIDLRLEAENKNGDRVFLGAISDINNRITESRSLVWVREWLKARKSLT